MRPRASQVAKTRLVETEEDVETYMPVLDAIKTAIRDRQAELARLEEELSADATEARGGGWRRRTWRPCTRTMTSVCRCTGQTRLTLSGGRWREQGEVQFSTYTLVKLCIFRHLHSRGGVGRGKNGGDNPLT